MLSASRGGSDLLNGHDDGDVDDDDDDDDGDGDGDGDGRYNEDNDLLGRA